jgi:hypothetical protein
MKAFRKMMIAGASLLLAALGPATRSLAADPPKGVTIGPLAKYYETVDFDHAMHTDIAENCATCHHHTVGTPALKGECATCHKKEEISEKVACRGCHAAEPFSSTEINRLSDGGKRYHIDMPGLKGAYHLSCLGCHEEQGGPTGCEDCHERNKLGDELFSAGATGSTKGAPHGHD